MEMVIAAAGLGALGGWWVRRRRSRRVPPDTGVRTACSTPRRGYFYTYRARNAQGGNLYTFRIYKMAQGSYRAYVERMPSYGGRNALSHVTHLLADSKGQRYICWTRPIPTAAQCEAVCRLWADNTQQYIAHGTRFH